MLGTYVSLRMQNGMAFKIQPFNCFHCTVGEKMTMVKIMDKYTKYRRKLSVHIITFYCHLANAPSKHTYLMEHVHLLNTLPTPSYTHMCQHDTKPGTTGTLITAMPNYQLLRRPVGEGGFLVVAIAASLLPASSLPQGEKRVEVGVKWVEVGGSNLIGLCGAVELH